MSQLYPKEKIIVSACLLGVACRYDGQSKENRDLKAWLEDKELIAFCPEAPSLGTPRPPITVVRELEEDRLIRSSDGVDVTQVIVDETQKIMKEYPEVKQAILKSKSPSCGCQTTPIFNTNNEQISWGDGLAASLMKKSSYTIRDENSYIEIKKEKDD